MLRRVGRPQTGRPCLETMHVGILESSPRASLRNHCIHKHVAAAVASADFKSVIEKTGVIPVSSSIDEFAAIIADTAKEAGAMIKELGIEQLD